MRRTDKFAALLRAAREPTGKTMGQLARHLGVSVPYISDVERGNRPPLTPDRIMKAAIFLGVDPTELLVAAIESRGAFELDARVPVRQQQVGLSLQRSWPNLPPETIEEIASAVEKAERKAGKAGATFEPATGARFFW